MENVANDRVKLVQVLIVDDEPGMVRYLQRALPRLGYAVAGTANTGTEAILFAESKRPGVVIMDVVLEDWSDGITAGRYIWQELHIPVVFCTARVDRASTEELATASPFGYLLKPFSEKELEQALANALREQGK